MYSSSMVGSWQSVGMDFNNIMQVIIEQQYIKFPPPQPPPPLAFKPYRHQPIRFAILAMVSTILLANEYTFNNPQALQLTLQQELSINQAQFNLLYTIIAIPNILFAVLVGLVIDYFGVRACFVAIVAAMPVFQAVVALGGVYSSFGFMLAGRFLFGLVNQSVIIVGCCFIAEWFIGKELGLALGLATTLPQFGNALNSLVTPIIYQQTQSLSAPLFTSVGLCGIGFILACIVTYIDIKADQTDLRNKIRIIADADTSAPMAEQFRLQDLKFLGPSYWLIACLCMVAIALYTPFFDNANKLLQVRFCFSQVTAGQNITVTYLVVGMFGFPLGWLIDRIGYRRYFAILGMVLFTLGHAIVLGFAQCDRGEGVVRQWSGVSWGLFLLGIAYCFYANCLIPSIPLVVKKKVTGTAFGVMEMLQNIAMAVYPTISASVVQHSRTPEIGFRMFSLFYTVTGLIGIVLSLLLLFIPDKDKIRVDASSKINALTKIKIETISLTDTEAMSRSKKSSNARNGYRTDNDIVLSDVDIGVEGSKRKFQVQMAKCQTNKTTKSAHKNRRRKKKEKLLEQAQAQASSEDNTEFQDKKSFKKTNSFLQN